MERNLTNLNKCSRICNGIFIIFYFIILLSILGYFHFFITNLMWSNNLKEIERYIYKENNFMYSSTELTSFLNRSNKTNICVITNYHRRFVIKNSLIHCLNFSFSFLL